MKLDKFLTNTYNMKNETHAEEQAKIQLETIYELVNKYKKESEEESAHEAILESPLEVGVNKQYFILLCTGGPAVRIIGNLNENSEPITASIQYQDLSTPWTDLDTGSTDEEIMLAYAQHFYFDNYE